MKKILVTGSVAYDLLLHYDGSFADALSEKSLETLSAAFVTPHFAKQRGGTGANIAWNLQLLSTDSHLVSTVGSDGTEYCAVLSENGVNVDHIEEVPASFTATAIVGTDIDERQITFFHPGADAHGTWPELSGIREEIGYAIVSPRDAGLMQQAIEWCHEWSVPVLFDPGQQLGAFSNDELTRMLVMGKGLIGNDYEWALLSQRLGLSIQEALKHLKLLIITHGEEGVEIHTPEESLTIKACKPEQVVNPTGAGDAFRAGFLAGLTRNWSLKDAGRLGAALASFVVEIDGPQLENFDPEQLYERALRTYGAELPEM